MPAEILTKAQAINFLGLDKKIFENYFINADEFHPIERRNGRGRFLFKKSELEEWLDDYKLRTVSLTLDDYALCLDFALAQHFRGYVTSDWGSARTREFGQKITNWVKGQLGEVAIKKFFKKKFKTEVELDFNIRGEIVPQDIIGIKSGSKTRAPKIGVAIKSSKPKSAFLVLSENEVNLPERRSDVYIFCRPDIPDDHLLRIANKPIIEVVRGKPHYNLYKDMIPSFEDIPCEIAGYCLISELERVHSIPGQDFENCSRYVKKSGKLHRTDRDWEKLIARL